MAAKRQRDDSPPIQEAVRLVREARYLSAFTGAGISVESGVPPFRGPGGLWSRYDPRKLELDYFHRHPQECWETLKEIFYDSFAEARPNEGHRVLARLEEKGLLKVLITQNIDNLHHLAGSRNVVEFHGNSRTLRCLDCGETVPADPARLQALPPRCRCGGILKPDIVFFGEGIPDLAWSRSAQAARRTDVMLVIGSTGEVYPAGGIPIQAAQQGATIVEINPRQSTFTESISDLFIQLPATEALQRIEEAMQS
ncbi:MAG: NAD-dependent deacylase [Spirochaetales bacterium]|nr:NAD-dependent deacylase [Spirochaetales bacterium]